MPVIPTYTGGAALHSGYYGSLAEQMKWGEGMKENRQARADQMQLERERIQAQRDIADKKYASQGSMGGDLMSLLQQMAQSSGQQQQQQQPQAPPPAFSSYGGQQGYGYNPYGSKTNAPTAIPGPPMSQSPEGFDSSPYRYGVLPPATPATLPPPYRPPATMPPPMPPMSGDGSRKL